MHFGSNVVLDFLRKLPKHTSPVVIRIPKNEAVSKNYKLFLSVEIYKFFPEFLRIGQNVGTEALTHSQPHIVWTELERQVIIVGGHESKNESIGLD